MPPEGSDLAAQVFKDPYLFDFLGTADPRREREVEKALLDHIQQFLLEMGSGFAFVGRQVHLEFASCDYYIDLLFYHLKLRCYVVIELKAVAFEPGFTGQLNMYLSAVDDLMRHPDDKPTIGLLLCRSKDKLVAEYALRGFSRPIGATASRVLGLPMASGLVASAALCADGSLARVGGLRSKVRLVVGDAPGVTRFLVARGQETEALEARDEALRDHGFAAADSWLVIEPVGTFHEAFELAFPGALDALRARWSEPVDAERLAEALYRTAIYGTPMVLGWSAMATCAHELSAKVASPATRARLDAARATARRHAAHGEPMPWPDEAELATMPRSRRLRLLAHVVQSAADVGTDAAAQANRALSLVRPRLERAPEDAVILGALGRAMAAGGDDDAATNALREAVDAWIEVGSPHESSHALCELLRLLAIAGRHQVSAAVRRGYPWGCEPRWRVEGVRRRRKIFAVPSCGRPAGAPRR
jgi:hypothetical protein